MKKQWVYHAAKRIACLYTNEHAIAAYVVETVSSISGYYGNRIQGKTEFHWYVALPKTEYEWYMTEAGRQGMEYSMAAAQRQCEEVIDDEFRTENVNIQR